MTEPAGPAVIIMARVPGAGGKTRLRGAMTEDRRAALEKAFLNDTVALALAANVGPVHVAYTPSSGRAWIEAELTAHVASFAQRGDGLGARLLAAMQRVAAQGNAPLLVIGTDAPLLQPGHLRSAVESLSVADVCLGPSEDGGYYLLGVRAVVPDLLRDVPWGTGRVLTATTRRATEAGLRYHLLDTLYDIDTPHDAERARADLQRLAREDSFLMPGRTRDVLLADATPAARSRGR